MYDAPMANAVSARRAADERRRLQTAALAVVALSILCAMDLSQLLFAAMGAACYLGLRAIDRLARPCISVVPPRAAGAGKRKEPDSEGRAPPGLKAPAQAARSLSHRPVLPPTFAAEGFEAEVEELVARMARTAESERVVRRVAATVERLVKPLLPEASVVGFVNSDAFCGAAFRVAVPEIEIVVCATPQDMTRPPGDRWTPHCMREVKDPAKLAKSTLRTVTDRLLSTGRFKFRRSAFRCDEPKVTLLAPPEVGSEATPLELSINAATPGFDAALLAECGRIDPRARALALLVRRWAKDRGACHAARGHLPPYAWTLLVVFFLQVGMEEEEGPILPPVSAFEFASTLASSRSACGLARRPWSPGGAGRSTARLFRDFIRFYAERCDLVTEAVGVWQGARRTAPRDSERPTIEDPFDAGRDLGRAMTAAGLAHFREELNRAATLCASGASLRELLMPWAPAEPEEHRGCGTECRGLAAAS
mmetsp:Transcript_71108/g.205905  ORF Transcript_71108/g.205905 Transcript_71108/m.205905 type:complete len:480 (+) Transcript_71108:71-1510(+)